MAEVAIKVRVNFLQGVGSTQQSICPQQRISISREVVLEFSSSVGRPRQRGSVRRPLLLRKRPECRVAAKCRHATTGLMQCSNEVIE